MTSSSEPEGYKVGDEHPVGGKVRAVPLVDSTGPFVVRQLRSDGCWEQTVGFLVADTDGGYIEAGSPGPDELQDLFFHQRLLLLAVNEFHDRGLKLPSRLAAWWENSPMNDDVNIKRVLRSIPDEDIDALNRYLKHHDELPREFD
jgi:hypothetical protein